MTERRRPRMIARLTWEETSGVDEPANLAPGWAVMKSRRIALDPVVLDMDILTKSADQQYTFGVCYKATESERDPELDAHREYIMADDLQRAAWEYVKAGDRNIYLQHGEQGIVPIGQWVDIVTWPYEAEVELGLPGQAKKRTTIPAGSVWMGVKWSSAGWELVKTGQIKGFSLGGRARRKTAEETEIMTKKTPLQEEFDQFLAGLKSAMSSQQYGALMSLLRVLVVGEQDLDDPAGAGQKHRFAPTREAMTTLLEDMKSLDLSDEVCIDVVRFLLHGNPLHPDYGDSEPGPVDDEATSKAIGDSGLGTIVTKVLGSAWRSHGTPLRPGVDALVKSGLDEEEAE